MFLQKLKDPFKLVNNKDRDENLKELLEDVKAVVFAGPKQKFKADEMAALKEFMAKRGGVVLIMASEGGEQQPFLHLNKFTSEFGITINNDAVVRTVYMKEYFHPKEVYIRNASVGVVLDSLSGKQSKSGDYDFEGPQVLSHDKLCVVYPFGCTLEVSKPAIPWLSSGPLSFPANRAIVAASKVGQGMLIVMGSVGMFDDSYVGKADNAALMTAVLKTLTVPEMKLETVDADRPEFQERTEVPDIEALSERLRGCLQEGEELPLDFMKLFDHDLFKFGTHMIPEAVKIYERLGVKHEPLSLIPPQFDVPLPPLQPAVFMPCLRELPPPALDLFDLDQHFASDKIQLAQLTNKCTDQDLEYFIREAGDLLGIHDKIREEEDEKDTAASYSAARILEYMLVKLVNYKKIDSDGSADPAAPGSTPPFGSTGAGTPPPEMDA